MKNRRRHLIFLPLIATLTIPFTFNACQAGLFSRKGFNSVKASACKPVLYNGKLAKLSDFDKPISPFAGGKVQLHVSDTAQAIQGKANGPVKVSKDTELSYIANVKCLRDNAQRSDFTLSKAALDSAQVRDELETQAFLWKLDRDFTESELQTIADADPCVSGVSWNRTYKLQSYNDPQRINQGHLNSIHADESYLYFYNSTGGMERASGTPVIVAVIDTGVDWQHPDLYNSLWRHSQGIGIDITTLGGAVDYNPFDVSSIGHGTHVSGLIAATTDNSVGTAGAMPFRAQIMAIKLFKLDTTTGEISTTSQHFYNAIQFAYLNGAQVINLSLGSITAGPSTDALADQGITEAVSRGVTVVTVIGNADSGQAGAEVNGTTLTSIPGIYANRAGVIGVGSYDVQTGLRSGFSHYSRTYAEIGAPGADLNLTGILSTVPRALSSYGRLAGTSQAAPLVSAAAALTIGVIRDATNVVPSPQEVERLILASAEKTQTLAPFFKDGNRLDLLRLIQKINTDYPQTQSSNSFDLSSTGCQ